MKYLDLSLPTPAANLACDEALLEGCEEGVYIINETIAAKVVQVLTGRVPFLTHE